MSRKVLFTQEVDPAGKELLEENGFEVVISPSEDRETLKELIVDAEGVFSATVFLDEDILCAGKKLQVVGKHGVGIDNVVSAETATKLGLYVVRTPMANSDSVAEHTVGGMLAFMQKVVQMHHAAQIADFEQQNCGDMHEINHRTIGLIGLGNIGSRVAKICAMGFDMKVLAYDPYMDPSRVPDYVELTDDIFRIYKESDFVSLHVGVTPETVGMVGAEQFAMMKPTAVFLNQARGALVQDDALYEALKNHVIKGAVIDVYTQEPAPADLPILGLDNVLLSPHCAALTDEAKRKMSYDGCKGILEVLTGQKPTWCVNYDEVNAARSVK
ncbi:MAG: hydroxyacid dehydrogenase [Lachnospiraceae bacterium]|nr:hydroxyacid dehydrogenase [Lachnospiraceae bacterium]